MNNKSIPQLPPAIVDRLLDNINPHRSAYDVQLRHAQRLAGRWLALRRLERKLVLPKLAAQLGVSVMALECLEAGIAEPGQLSAYSQTRLCNALAQSRTQIDWLAQVIALALGDAAMLNSSVTERIVRDLERADPARSSDVLLVLEITLPSAEGLATNQPHELLAREPLAVLLLQALAVTTDHSLEQLWQQIDRAKKRFDLATQLGGLLQVMCDTGLVRMAREEATADVDDEPIVYYGITVLGRQVLQQHLRTGAIGGTQLPRPTS